MAYGADLQYDRTAKISQCKPSAWYRCPPENRTPKHDSRGDTADDQPNLSLDWSGHGREIVAGIAESRARAQVPLKTYRVERSINLLKVVVFLLAWRGSMQRGCSLKYRPRHLTMVENAMSYRRILVEPIPIGWFFRDIRFWMASRPSSGEC
ncbi:hypothetical protein TNCV_5057881 [Trichonephila clavipes]|nr:hypothetical protein TNCV_5057881 [Trichonephila clavipes]